MQERRAVGLMCLMTVTVGYLVFGWIGVVAGLLAVGLLSAGRCLRRLRRCEHRQVPTRHPAGGRCRQRVQLEALLARAQMLAGRLQDGYGARTCCLEIIRQTEREDPLFLAACDLFTSTMSGRTVRPGLPTTPSAARVHGIDVRAAVPPCKANVIFFPLPAPRH